MIGGVVSRGARDRSQAHPRLLHDQRAGRADAAARDRHAASGHRRPGLPARARLLQGRPVPRRRRGRARDGHARRGRARRAPPRDAADGARRELAAASMAGMPLFLGFIAKEQLYESVLAIGAVGLGSGVLVAAAVVASCCLGAAGLIAGVSPFVGRSDAAAAAHEAPPALWLGSARPGRRGRDRRRRARARCESRWRSAAAAVTRHADASGLALWHGFTADAGAQRADAGWIDRPLRLAEPIRRRAVAARAADGAAVLRSRWRASTRSAAASRRRCRAPPCARTCSSSSSTASRSSTARAGDRARPARRRAAGRRSSSTKRVLAALIVAGGPVGGRSRARTWRPCCRSAPSATASR